MARRVGLVTKSNLILGHGRDPRGDHRRRWQDLRSVGTDLLTITQYLRPSVRHHPIERWVKPEEFVELRDEALGARLRRRDERSAGAVVVPRRSPLPAGARLAAVPADATTTPDPSGRCRKRYDDGTQRTTARATKSHGQGRRRRQSAHPRVYRRLQDDPQSATGGSASICLAWFLGVALVRRWPALALSLYPSSASSSASRRVHWPGSSCSVGEPNERRTPRSRARPGAAGAALGILRKGWQVQQAVAVTKNQDLVHRVVGRPGVDPRRRGQRRPGCATCSRWRRRSTRGSSARYRSTTSRWATATTARSRCTPLAKHIQKLPRNITPADITDVMQRLRALDAMRPQIPIPKGPMPTSAKQARAAMRGSPAAR